MNADIWITYVRVERTLVIILVIHNAILAFVDQVKYYCVAHSKITPFSIWVTCESPQTQQDGGFT